MFYIIYKTINILNKKYYIGCHQTTDLNDGYLGSGKHLRHAIKKYGKENFAFEIIHFANSKEEMFELERSIVNEALVNDPLSYNLKIGGCGGNPGILGAFLGKKHTEETKEKIRKAATRQQVKAETRKKISENNWAKKDPEAHREHVRLLGKLPKSEIHKEKLRQASIHNCSGKNNAGKIRNKITCPHCGTVGAMNTLSRWHFEKCKKNISLAQLAEQ